MQSVYKSCIALAGNNGQDVDILHLISQHFRIHAVPILVHAQTQSTAYFLPLLRGAVAVLQGADLEHIRVIPTFPQCGVGEDEPGRLFKGQQTFLVFQDQIIGRNVIRHIRATLDRTVDAVTFLVDAEIALMDIMHIG